MFETNYFKNIQALESVNASCAEAIKKAAKGESFELTVIDSDYGLFSIEDRLRAVSIYPDLVAQMQSQLKRLKTKTEYDYLYLYGIGNAYALPILLKNPKHKRIVIIEPEAEILFVALHLADMADALMQGRLVLILEKQLTFAQSVHLFLYDTAKLYARSFELIPNGTYYETYYGDAMQKTHQLLLDGLSHNITTSGNDITDSLVGVAHHIRHLKAMIEAPAFEALKRQKNSSWAVIVATGPSLSKQLPLLKKVAPYVTIISVDASLPILEQHAIQPDLVTSIERVALTAQFFKRTSQAFHKETIFVCASLEHDETLDAIGGTKILAMRPFDYNRYFELDDYGYVGAGMSAANMAHELAFIMGYDQVVLIGQDLAYAQDGTSHSDGHVFGAQEIDPASRAQYEVPAYGGKGNVKTQIAWKLFLGYFEYAVAQQQGYMKTYNATEGGARIAGSIEKPFAVLVDEIIRACTPKKPILLAPNDPVRVAHFLARTKEKVARLLEEGTLLKNAVEAAFVRLSDACKPLEGLDRSAFLSYFDQEATVALLDEIAHIRTTMAESPIYNAFFADVMQATMLHLELDIAQIKVRYVNDAQSNHAKAMDWIVVHQYWLFQVAGSLHNTLELIRENNPFD